MIAGHEPPLLWAIIIWVIMIRWRSRRSHVQFARVERQDRSTLTRNSDKRSVIVHATPPLGWMNGSSTSGHLKENQCRSDHECKGYFHREILSYTFCDPSRITGCPLLSKSNQIAVQQRNDAMGHFRTFIRTCEPTWRDAGDRHVVIIH